MEDGNSKKTNRLFHRCKNGLVRACHKMTDQARLQSTDGRNFAAGENNIMKYTDVLKQGDGVISKSDSSVLGLTLFFA